MRWPLERFSDFGLSQLRYYLTEDLSGRVCLHRVSLMHHEYALEEAEVLILGQATLSKVGIGRLNELSPFREI